MYLAIHSCTTKFVFLVFGKLIDINHMPTVYKHSVMADC